MAEVNKRQNHTLRKNRVRAKVFGTEERPRLTVFISNVHVSAQIINDQKQHTLVSATTVGAKLAGSKTDLATQIGMKLAKAAKKVGIKKVVFDRNGRKYAGRLRALAEAARKEGLEF